MLTVERLVERLSPAERDRAERVESVLPKVAALAASADRAGAFPREHVVTFREAGLLGLVVPEAYGGLGGGLRDLAGATFAIGTVCPSTALTFFFHCSAVSRGLLALEAIEARDFERLATLSESSCLKMHGVMQSSLPAMIYWRPATLACIHAVRELRNDGTPVFFTIDAGPQVKAVCPPEAVEKVEAVLGDIPGVIATHTVGLGEGARLVES